MDQKADVWVDTICTSSKGTVCTLHTFAGSTDVHIKMVGAFNIYNALAAVTTLLLEGIPLTSIKEGLENINGVRGRLETIDAGQLYTVIVDYAHTPDSLENVLSTIKGISEGSIICVVGCGGDRDRLKRPTMAKIAVDHSDITIFTSDNPRTEDPNMILLEMVDGVQADSTNFYCIEDRKEAIQFALQKAKKNDIVLIAGKGHETYQEINGVRYAFDDREVVKSAIQNMNGE
jgi:UDP-N-acetylmuramoyl-L-alanyl-D-glutamate--2,6-diaminopimelate ligase